MKHSILAAFAILGLGSCAHADLIKQSSTYTRTVLMTSASDHISPYTGAASTLSVQYALAGGAMTTPTTAPTIAAQGNGRFAITLTGAYTGTLGALDLTVTASGADPSDTHDQVVAFDPNDAAALGLSKIALVGTNAGDSPNAALAQGQATANGMALTTLLKLIGTPAGVSLAVDIAAVKADTGTLTNHQKGRFTYNPATHALQLLQDDGVTPLGSPLTLTVDSTGNITSR